MSVFGKAKFGGNKRTWFKLKDGDSVYRILPPMGDLQEDGRWSAFYSIHYGYRNSKDEMRTFVSPLIKNRKTKMVESPDPALDRINTLKAKLEDAKKSGNEELKVQLLKLVGGQKSRYNLDNNHYVNVVDLQGNVGILKIRHKCKLALDAQIKKLRDAGVDPLDPETGRFFVFTRSGMGMDTVYQVSVYKRKIQVDGIGEVEQDLVHAITEDLARRCLVENKDGSYTYKEAGRLDSLFKKPTSEEVARFVLEGASAVDEILDAKKDATGAPAEEVNVDDSGSEEDETLAPAATAPANTATVTAPPATTTVTQAAPPVTETKAAAPATAAKVAETRATSPAAPKTTAEAVTDLSEADFLKSLGL